MSSRIAARRAAARCYGVAMVQVTREQKRAWLAACKPDEPLPAGDARYVAFDQAGVRGTASRPCLEELVEGLLDESPQGESKRLLTGPPGTGKTTELRRLIPRLEADEVPTRVLYVDAEAWIDPFEPLDVTDILRLGAFALDREATIAEGKDPDKIPGYGARFLNFLKSTNVDVKEIKVEAGVGVMAELRASPDFHKRVQAGLAQRFQAFATEARRDMDESVARIRAASKAERIVVLVDSLEKLTAINTGKRREMEEAVEAVFTQHARWLSLPCHVVYSIPLWLRFRASLGAHFYSEPVMVPMVKIAEPGGGAPYEPGVALLRDLVARRIDKRAVFGEDSAVLDDLIQASGGYPKDLLRLLRGVITRSPMFPVPRAAAEETITRMLEDYELAAARVPSESLLRYARSHDAPSEPEELEGFGELVRSMLVLAYRNGSTWFDVHPILRRGERLRAKLAGGA